MKKSPAAVVNTLNILWQSAALTLLGVLFVAGLCYWLTPATSADLTATYQQWFIERVRYAVLPEAKEQNTYVLTTLLMPVLAYLAVKARKWSKNLLRLLALCWLALTGAFLFGNPEFVNMAFCKAGQNMSLAVNLTTLALLLGLLLRLARRWRCNQCLLLVLGLSAGLLMTAASTLYVPEKIAQYFSFHFDPVLYAVAETARGMHFVHQYGFYPEFLSPLFQLFSATIRNVNVVFSAMIYLSFAFVLFAASKMIRNPLVFLCTAVSLLLFCTTAWGMVNGNGFDPYFPYYPIRTIFPTLFLALAAVYCTRPGRYMHLTAGLLAGAGLFWNFDVGLVGFGAFLFLFGAEMWFDRRGKWRSFVTYCTAFAVSASLVWGYFCYVNQQILTFDVLFKMQKSCAVAGYFMLPMPGLPYFWAVPATAYVTGIVWGIFCLSRRDNDPGARWVMFASVTGLGILSYYIGRSHVLNLPHVLYPALLIFGVWLDRAVRLVRVRQLRLVALALAFPGLFFAAASLWCTVTSLPHLKNALLFNLQGVIFEQPGPLHVDAEYIRNMAAGRKVNIYGMMQGFFFAQSLTRGDVVNGNEVEMILQPELERIVRQTASSGAPLFLSKPASWSIPFDEAFLAQYYEFKGVSPTGVIRYYEPRKH